MQHPIVRQVVGVGDGFVIGCLGCGEVEHLQDGAEHHCTGPSDPTAVTLATNYLCGPHKLAIPSNE